MKKKNARIEKMRLSPIRTMMERAKELERQGRPIVHLELGEPNFRTPAPIVEATVRALRDGFTHYGPDEGVDELREVIARKFYAKKGLQVDPYENIIITTGASEAIFDTVVGLTGPGHSVLIPEPAFGNYYNCCLCAGSQPVNVPLRLNDKSRLDFAALEAALDSNTAFIILNNPHNPTGGMFPASEIEKLANFVLENDLIVIADEIYEDIFYGSEPPLSIASLPGMQERTIVIGGFSKSYAMTGWRVGYAVVPTPLFASVQKVHQYAVTCVSTFSQVGIANSIERCDTEVQAIRRELKKRRQYLIEDLNKVEGVSYITPEGAFYLFINIGRFGLSAMEFSERLLEEKGLATVPGSAFGPSGEGYIRISYATSLQEIEKGISILRDFIAGLY
ncbi:MAG: pyridoxal phosphate-dependent aminotransferase [Firmicutes bacterium]|nr:pyridoxal phosphate-dependent aminotransferase [Bacillota bacterium]